MPPGKDISQKPEPRARLSAIVKRFGAFTALDNINLSFSGGAIHAVLGENGAGKSTLMRILAGLLKPDEGRLDLDGRETVFSSRREALRSGIGLVQQHYGLVLELTGVDNCLLGHPNAGAWIARGRIKAALLQTAERVGLDIDPTRVVSTLTIGERQRLEILIALTIGAELLILDEPTAALVTSEVQALIPMLRRLAAQGMSIVYITHKLDEVMEIADQITVLRRGRVSGEFQRGNLDKDQLIEAMIGRLPSKERVARPALGEIVAALNSVDASAPEGSNTLKGLDLVIRQHEIVGVAGVAGNGQELLAEVLRGLCPPTNGTFSCRSNRVAYIPEDRARDGLALGLSIADNAILYRHRERGFSHMGRLDRDAVDRFTARLCETAGVSTSSTALDSGSLSGGNQQKLVIARELDTQPDLIVAHNPYRGLDVGATEIVRKSLLDARDAGAGIVLISPDLDDLFDIADRIVFLSRGQIVGSVDPTSTGVAAVGELLAAYSHA